ncbi:type VII secretion protein EccB [Mycobacterium heidelbergense]|uniref:Type VII secretion protein EccB n=1 Tax=Mycobacterium heidelbergense TaxID=53376 RepID=A0A1X0DHP7_MYCHE|nr:type VII secretion protein EccB [Mycobacterium heidelbergense]MCV7052767.1 type VII secretion protein EccB [Mycobacterium heidelbergense]ORA71895.1 type VII secretion protein EccB [Mycobacterium heidelbergense]BBZ49383.1 ESX-4 secretion system ATPase EccB4 [Mycobacterium heidelbergense]
MDRSSPRRPTTRLQVSGYRFLLRRMECALLGGDIGAVNGAMRWQAAALTAGCVLAAVAMAGCAVLGLLGPHAQLDRARIVVAQPSGALYVRVGDRWHPVLNLSSARLIAATADNPRPVRESDLARTKRGPLLGIPGAPQLLGTPLSADESTWTICDTDGAAATTVVVGPTDGPSVHRLGPDRAILVAPASGSPAYLLYDGQRAVVDIADPAVVRALRLEGHAPRPVSQALLNAVPEAAPISAPRIPGAGGQAPGLPGLPIGGVLRVTRGDGEEYYVVLAAGVQRIGRVAADLLRLGNSQGTVNPIPVAPDAIRAAAIVDTLPVASFPDRPPTLWDDGATVCAAGRPLPSGNFEIALLAGAGLPVPGGQAPVTLAQADGRGPALDAVYVPPGRSAFVRTNGRGGTRYLVTDTGVRFAIHDDDAARDLGLSVPTPAPWPVLAVLPSGPELSRRDASVARDAVAGPQPAHGRTDRQDSH